MNPAYFLDRRYLLVAYLKDETVEQDGPTGHWKGFFPSIESTFHRIIVKESRTVPGDVMFVNDGTEKDGKHAGLPSDYIEVIDTLMWESDTVSRTAATVFSSTAHNIKKDMANYLTRLQTVKSLLAQEPKVISACRWNNSITWSAWNYGDNKTSAIGHTELEAVENLIKELNATS